MLSPAVATSPVAFCHVEGFEVLERIGRLGYADRFADHLVKINELLPAQQVVQLMLGDGVTAGEAFQAVVS